MNRRRLTQSTAFVERFHDEQRLLDRFRFRQLRAELRLLVLFLQTTIS